MHFAFLHRIPYTVHTPYYFILHQTFLKLLSVRRSEYILFSHSMRTSIIPAPGSWHISFDKYARNVKMLPVLRLQNAGNVERRLRV